VNNDSRDRHNPHTPQQPWTFAIPLCAGRVFTQKNMGNQLMHNLHGTYISIGKMLFEWVSEEGRAPVKDVRRRLVEWGKRSKPTIRKHLELLASEAINLLTIHDGYLYLHGFLTTNKMSRMKIERERRKARMAVAGRKHRDSKKENSFPSQNRQVPKIPTILKKKITLLITASRQPAAVAEQSDVGGNCFLEENLIAPLKTLPPKTMLAAEPVLCLPTKKPPEVIQIDQDEIDAVEEELLGPVSPPEPELDIEDIDDDDPAAIRALFARDIGARHTPQTPLAALGASSVPIPDVADLTTPPSQHKPVVGTVRVPQSPELTEADFAALRKQHPELSEMRWDIFKRGRPQMQSTLAAIRGAKGTWSPAGAVLTGEAKYRCGQWKVF
jgi:hypothetical protein